MEQKYVIVKDSKGCRNVWEIGYRDDKLYVISSRTTMTYISKESCKIVNGSSLLYCDGIIDILPSDIEIEKWSEYENYLLHNIYEEEITI